MAKAKMILQNIDLDALKASKWAELGSACEKDILKPYQSKIVLDSTGKAHLYGTDLTDQANMQAKCVLMLTDRSVVDIPFKVKDAGFVNHTREEFVAIIKEIGSMIETNRIKCGMKRSTVANATTAEEVLAVKWE